MRPTSVVNGLPRAIDRQRGREGHTHTHKENLDNVRAEPPAETYTSLAMMPRIASYVIVGSRSNGRALHPGASNSGPERLDWGATWGPTSKASKRAGTLTKAYRPHPRCARTSVLGVQRPSQKVVPNYIWSLGIIRAVEQSLHGHWRFGDLAASGIVAGSVAYAYSEQAPP